MVVFKRNKKIEDCISYLKEVHSDDEKMLKRVGGFSDTQFFTIGELMTLVEFVKKATDPHPKKSPILGSLIGSELLITEQQQQQDLLIEPSNSNSAKKAEAFTKGETKPKTKETKKEETKTKKEETKTKKEETKTKKEETKKEETKPTTEKQGSKNSSGAKKRAANSKKIKTPQVETFQDLIGDDSSILDEMPDPKRQAELEKYDPCVRDQLEKIRREVEQQEYSKWVANISPQAKSQKRLFQPGEWSAMTQYTGIAINLLVSMASMFVVGWYLGDKAWGRVGGIVFGLFCAIGIMLVEIWLYMLQEKKREIREAEKEKQKTKKKQTAARKKKKND